MSAKTQASTPRYDLEDSDTRMEILTEMLVQGASRIDLQNFAMQRWQIGRRSAEVYVQTVRKRLIGEAAEGDRLFYLRLSQLQRDQLISIALRYTLNQNYDPQVMHSLSAMITAARGLLDSRDRAAGEIFQLVQEKITQVKQRLAERAGAEPNTPGDNGTAKESCAPEPLVRKDGEAVAPTQAEASQRNGTPQPGTNGHPKGHGIGTPPVSVRRRSVDETGDDRRITSSGNELADLLDAGSPASVDCADCAAGI